jgi:hypothetical protein
MSTSKLCRLRSTAKGRVMVTRRCNARGFTDPLRPSGPSLRNPQGLEFRLPKMLTLCQGDAAARAVIGPLTTSFPAIRFSGFTCLNTAILIVCFGRTGEKPAGKQIDYNEAINDRHHMSLGRSVSLYKKHSAPYRWGDELHSDTKTRNRTKTGLRLRRSDCIVIPSLQRGTKNQPLDSVKTGPLRRSM